MSTSGPWLEKAIGYRVQLRLHGRVAAFVIADFVTHAAATAWAQDVFEGGLGRVAGYQVDRQMEDGSWRTTVSVERGR